MKLYSYMSALFTPKIQMLIKRRDKRDTVTCEHNLRNLFHADFTTSFGFNKNIHNIEILTFTCLYLFFD